MSFISNLKDFISLHTSDMLVKRKKYSFSAQESQWLCQLYENGVVVIEDFYSPQECEDIVKSIDAILVEKSDQIWSDSQLSDLRIFGSENLDEKIRSFNQNQSLLNFANEIEGKECIAYTTLAAKLRFVSGNLGSGGGWHRDTALGLRQFKSIVYLTDVDNENGPFQYIVGTQRKRSLIDLFLRAKVEYGQNRIDDDEIDVVLTKKGYRLQTFAAKRGTLILTNTFGIHRGMPIQNGVRYALTNYYYPKNADFEYLDKKFNPIK